MFYCFAAINNRGSRFILDTTTIKANFISPGIELSQPNLFFRIDVTPLKDPVIAKKSKCYASFKNCLMSDN